MTGAAPVLPRVKVCGLTHVEDVRAAVAAGADALGFVFHPPSPRSVTPERIRMLRDGLPAAAEGGPWIVGVVVDLDPDAASAFATAAGVDALQLCGGQRAGDWAGFPVPLLRRLPVDASGAAELESWRAHVAGFVLDHPSTPGGSGRTVDLGQARALCARAPCLLAGGLSADNVASAVDAVRPHGVDASSRLERMPGRKNPASVLAFVRAAHTALVTAPSSTLPDRPPKASPVDPSRPAP